MIKNFNYVIARPWEAKKPKELCVYSFGSEVQCGSLEDAENLLEYVSKKSTNTYSIYKVKYKKLKKDQLE